tara:strand:+ start:3471 stop:3680 length:210 start_codon:yes stop_codon:yes gene_type:complete
MVLKRRKFKNEPTGNTGNRKGYRSRSSESQLPNKRMSNADLKRATTLLPKKSPSEMADSITNYYKDLMK